MCPLGGILFLKSTTVHVSENGNRPMFIGTILSFYICTNFYVAGELYSYYIYIYIYYILKCLYSVEAKDDMSIQMSIRFSE